MKFIISIFILVLTACVSNSNLLNSKGEPPFVGIESNNLIYRGSITQAANETIFEAYSRSHQKPQKLIISSSGGDIGLGIELGRWVNDNNLDVEVSSLCASSCANYVFPAGNRKYLRKDSILIWHGSAWQANWETSDLSDELLSEYLDPIRTDETSFFDKLKIDNLLTVYGHTKLTTWDSILALFGQDKLGWDYSLEDMNRFGLSNIILIDEEWDWRKYNPNKGGLVKRVNVDNNYQFKLHRFLE